MLVAVIGQGYVGLPLSMAVVSAGHQVLAVESDPARRAALRSGRSYIVDTPSEELAWAVRSGRLQPVPDLSDAPGADVYLIAVPTPVTPDNEPDLSFVHNAIATVAASVRPGALVVVESTLYPGAMRAEVQPRFAALVGEDVCSQLLLAYSPQRIDPGRDVDYRAVPKLVAGLDERARAAAGEFYDTVFKNVVRVPSTEVAEFAKLLENTFRYVNIAFVNEMATVAHRMGVDFRQVVEAAASKPYGYLPFWHGPGVGGHCLPNNVHYLRRAISDAGGSSELLATAVRVNDSMPRYTVERLQAALEHRGSGLNGARVLLIGLSYKPDVADARHSPTYAISDAIVARGGEVRVADPTEPRDAAPASFVRTTLTREECARADAVVLLTDHEQIDYAMVVGSSRLILDCRGRLRDEKVERL